MILKELSSGQHCSQLRTRPERHGPHPVCWWEVDTCCGIEQTVQLCREGAGARATVLHHLQAATTSLKWRAPPHEAAAAAQL